MVNDNVASIYIKRTDIVSILFCHSLHTKLLSLLLYNEVSSGERDTNAMAVGETILKISKKLKPLCQESTG